MIHIHSSSWACYTLDLYSLTPPIPNSIALHCFEQFVFFLILLARRLLERHDAVAAAESERAHAEEAARQRLSKMKDNLN
jgi:hypothetical protein